MERKGSISKITKDFPQPADIHETQNGFNYKYQGETYSFYYGAKPASYSKMVHKGETHRFTAGQELDLIKRLPAFQKYFSAPHIKPKKEKLPIGAKACIDHIKKKIEFIKKDQTRDNTRVLNILKHLCDELHQYI